MDNRKLAKFATVWCNPGVLDRMAKSDEQSAQLIECVNPEHLYLGSIHYLQTNCVGKWERPDSDESWQASEALLKHSE